MRKLQPILIGYFQSYLHVIASCVVLILVLSGVGCSLLKRGKEPVSTQPIPLTPVIWFSPSVTTAEVPYHDGCGETRSLPLTDALVTSIPKKLMGVFTGVAAQSHADEPIASDGVVEVGVGVRRIELAVPTQTPGTFPAKAMVGIEMVFLARDGTLLFNKKFEGTGHGTVTVGQQLCQVEGVAAIVQDAIDSATNGLAQQIGQSVQIREYAARRDTWVPVATRPGPSLEPSTANLVASLPTVGETTEKPPQVASSTTGESAQLSFRAIIRDGNGDQFLQPDESLTIQVEVKNEGMGEAKDVMVMVEGKTDLVALFPSEVHLGMLQSGEIKRTSMTQRVTASQEALQGE
ncbi:MAG: hypothetical protein HOO98_08265, partial [Nitrospira sp.]|nr:hypothetical protein [Nitrospira sp.]